MCTTRLTAFAAGLLLAAVALPAQADIINFTSSIDGPQAGTDSPATGSATMTYDDETLLLTWEITWTPLQGNVTAAHFHGPAPPGQDAGIQIPIDDLTSPSMGSATVTPEQESDLFAELLYINIHSSVEPSGEIRGQVLLAVADDDGDGVPNDSDNCPNAANPGQEDDDADTRGNVCDNCTAEANMTQDDNDADGFGDICDSDFDNDCNINFTDLGEMKANFFVMGDLPTDVNNDGNTNFSDLGFLKADFFSVPGPSGVPNVCSP